MLKLAVCFCLVVAIGGSVSGTFRERLDSFLEDGFGESNFQNPDDLKKLLYNDKVLKDLPRELIDIIVRVNQRMQEGAIASDEEVDELHDYLEDGKDMIYEFVTGPFYNQYADTFIDEVVYAVKKLLGVMPVEEWKTLLKVMIENPDLVRTLTTLKQEKDFKKYQMAISDPDEIKAAHMLLDNPSGYFKSLKEKFLNYEEQP